MKFAIYARQSKFVNTGDSIEHQINKCKKYIFDNFDNVNEEDIEVFFDEDFTGKNTNRPQFQLLMERIAKKGFDVFVCYHLNRASRNINDFSNLLNYLKKYDVKFISTKQHFDTSTVNGRGMIYMTAVFAQMERETIAECVKDNMLFLAQSGQWLGGKPPFGFNSQKLEKTTYDGKLKTACYLFPNHNELKIIETIFEKFLETGCIYTTAKYLNYLNLRTRNNALFSCEIIRNILTNPVYCTADKHSFAYFKSKNSNVFFTEKDFYKHLGIVSYNRKSFIENTNHARKNDISKWVIALGKHPGIIRGIDWVNAQNILAKNFARPHTFDSNGLLTGLLFCPKCNSKMSVKTNYQSANRPFYYICRKKLDNGCSFCNSKNFAGHKTDKKIIDYLMHFDEKELKKKLHFRKHTQQLNKITDQSEEIHFQIIELKEQQQKYLKHLLKVSPDSPFALKVQDAINSIDLKIKNLQSQKADLNFQLKVAQDNKSTVEQVVKNLSYFKHNFSSLDTKQKKSLLRLIIDKIIWNNGDFDIIFNYSY